MSTGALSASPTTAARALSGARDQARAVHAALTGAGPSEHPAAVIAALADTPTTTARRHLRHLVRIGAAHPGTAPDTFLPAVQMDPGEPLNPEATGRVTAWYLGCTFQAARVLGAAALPGGKAIDADPSRPPHVPADRPAALDWFALHRGRLTEVLRSACADGDDARGWRLGLLMLNIGCFTGPWDGWRAVCDLAMHAAGRARHTRAQAMVHEYAGKLELTGGDVQAARARHLLSMELRRASGDVHAAVRSLNTLGVSWLREGSLPEARSLFTEALAMAEVHGYEEFTAYAVMNLGAVHARDGHPAQAVTELHRAIEILPGQDREPYIANALSDLCAAHRALDEVPRARQIGEAAARAAANCGVPMFLPGPLVELAELDVGDRQYVSALARLHEARAIYTQIGDRLRAAQTRNRIDQVTRLIPDDPDRSAEAAVSNHPDAPSTQEDAVNQDPLWLGPAENWKLGPAEARIHRTEIPLCEEARVLLRLLAGAGRALPVAVAAALVDQPTAVARRHLDQLVRTGAVLRTGQGYTAVDGAEVTRPLVPELRAWARVTEWYLSCAYRAADVLGAAALPDDETVAEDSERPAVALRDAVEATAWYQATHPELYAVLDRAVAAEDHPRVWRLALLMANIAIVAGPLGAWEQALDLGLAAARRDGHLGGQAMLLEYTGKLLLHDGRFDAARTAHQAALTLRESTGDRIGLARSTNALGLVAMREGNADLAARLFTRCLALAEEVGSEVFTAFARLNLGCALVAQNLPLDGREQLEQAAAYLRETGRRNYLANALYQIAATHRMCGEHDRALIVATEAVHEATDAGLSMYLAGPLGELAENHRALGNEQAALEALAEARAIHAELGDVTRAMLIEAQIEQITRHTTTPLT
ncbi:MAG TPA: tetratricopeptide repeat protein [Actinospica sp.]|jgi:tetratricopeptide (TPR) repeat protein|nr:tetratricopeptide repeat protein [Actinospica sp.]